MSMLVEIIVEQIAEVSASHCYSVLGYELVLLDAFCENELAKGIERPMSS